MEADPRWYETFFDRDWLTIAAGLHEQTTRGEVDFLAEKLELEPGARVLDLACGKGRHAVELASRGFRVTGIDISGPSLDLARERAAERGVDVELVNLDMRELAVASEFDTVFNFQSSFGYLPSEEEDLEVLERVAEALVPGGRFLIETINLLGLIRNYQPRSWRTLGDGSLLTEDRSYDAITGRSRATWTIVRPDGSRSELHLSMRIYSCPELRRMLAQAGLAADGVWGGIDGSEYGVGGRRLIVRGRKS